MKIACLGCVSGVFEKPESHPQAGGRIKRYKVLQICIWLSSGVSNQLGFFGSSWVGGIGIKQRCLAVIDRLFCSREAPVIRMHVSSGTLEVWEVRVRKTTVTRMGLMSIGNECFLGSESC